MWALVAPFLATLVEVLESRIGAIVISLLLSLGLSFTTYKLAVAPFETLISSTMSGAGDLLPWVGFFGADKFITIVLSAIAARAASQGARAFLTKKAA